MTGHTIVVEVTRDMAACHMLRRKVFIEEQGVSEAEELDDLDDSSIHLLASLNGLPVGSARLRQEGETGKVGRVCVLAEARGTGLGAALMNKAAEVFRGLDGVREVKLGAQISAKGFYEKLGYSAYGPEFDDAGIPHVMMRLPLIPA
jgi:predicted GNAT family N-acyltransferase